MAKLVASQSDQVAFITLSSKPTRVGQFIRSSLPVFTGSKFEEDSKQFICQIEKIFSIMHDLDVEGVELSTY